MKKLISLLMISIMSIIIFCNVVVYADTCENDTYILGGTIVSVINGVATMEDYTGNLWAFDSKGYKVNDKVLCLMGTNDSDVIYDDVVIATTYNGCMQYN